MAYLSNISRFAVKTGFVSLGISGLFYFALKLTSDAEQAHSPGEKNYGVAVLFMMFGIPMVFFAGTALISFLISAFTWTYQKLFQSRSSS